VCVATYYNGFDGLPLQALIVGPFPFLVTYSSQLPLMQAPAGSERHLLLTRSFCAAVLGVSATYWLRFRLNDLVCIAAESGAADSGGGKLALVCYTVAYFSRTYTAIKLVGWCAAKIRRPLSNVLSNTPQPLPARTIASAADSHTGSSHADLIALEPHRTDYDRGSASHSREVSRAQTHCGSGSRPPVGAVALPLVGLPLRD
jgi:hypothetical protein